MNIHSILDIVRYYNKNIVAISALQGLLFCLLSLWCRYFMMNEINNDAKNNVELALIKLDMAVFKDILDDIPRIFELRSGVLELEYLSAEILGTLKIRDSI